MKEASAALDAYLRGVQRVSGAESVSIYVAWICESAPPPILIHCGHPPPASELANLQAAKGFLTATLETHPPERRYFEGEAPTVRLLRLATQAQPSITTDGRQELSLELTERPQAWLAMRFGSAEAAISLDRQLDSEIAWSTSLDWLSDLGAAMLAYYHSTNSVLRDPVSGLPGRNHLQRSLAEELDWARRHRRPLSLILVNPDDFVTVNEQIGWENGDRVVREIASRLHAAVRNDDIIAKYGGVIFALVVRDANIETAHALGLKIRTRLSQDPYLAGRLELRFSLGIGTYEPHRHDVQDALDLIRWADQGLGAAKRSSDGLVCWRPDTDSDQAGQLGRLSGIFTGNMNKDYRNMVLLWEALATLVAASEPDQLARQVVDRLNVALKTDRVAIFAREGIGEAYPLSEIAQSRPGPDHLAAADTIDRDLLTRACATRRPLKTAISRAGEDRTVVAHAIPLIVDDAGIGCLYLEGREDLLRVDSADLLFLKALAAQLGVALDRARLSHQARVREDLERHRIRAELNELRSALQQSRMVYRSPQMEELLHTARRAAQTDATLLITGESGTGKELLAQTIHELSPRKGRPFVVVDCGSIPPSLIESELFGHERGAYTGADARRPGRLAQADEGTVLLDEVSELPLEVQSKLLRFTQEKLLTSVGGSNPRRIDVRIIAASNRELELEVEEGRFRKDLFFRLDVLRLRIPPLRNRTEDILFLSRYFLERFAIQYQKPVLSFTTAAENALVSHGWPGNVRELQNRVLQAVILSEGETIGVTQLRLEGKASGGHPVETSLTTATDGSIDPWHALRAAFAAEVSRAAAMPGTPPPIGRWLADDLALEAFEVAGGVVRSAALLVGIPETTFGRRLRKAQGELRSGLAPRSPSWPRVRTSLATLLRHSPIREGLGQEVANNLCEQVVVRGDLDARTQAAILGVTAPTLRKRVAKLKSAGPLPPA